MTRVIVIAQARMGSSRLPGKVLRRAGGLSLLEHLARRLARAQTPTDRVIATTTDPSDDALVDAARALGFTVHRGPVDDVLARYCGALSALAAAPGDVVVRVTADCPLLDPAELDRCVRELIERRATPLALDYLTNQAGEVRRIPRGLDVEVFEVAALERAERETDDAGDREHVTPYLYRVPGRFRTLVSDPPGEDLGHLRLTVDTPEDLALVDAIVGALGPDPSTAAIATWLAEHPEVARLNAGIKQKSTLDERSLRASRIAGRLLLARADASPSAGFGHVTRVGALLDAWTEAGGRACLVGAGLAGSIRARLEAHGIELVEPGTNADREFEDRFADAAALVLDGYGFTQDQQRRWQAAKPLLVIDDLADHPQQADLVVNQILDFPSARYLTAAHTRLLLGHPYVLLRREFRGASQRPPEPRVVLTFGGSDPAQLSARMTRALVQRTTERLQVIAGVGVDPSVRAELEQLADAHPRVELHVDVREMAALLAGASLCVSAAGTTVWEAMALGVPIATVAVADNQRPVLAGIERREAGLSLGWHGDLDLHDGAARIAALLADSNGRAALAQTGRALVDGRGVYRVIDALLDRLDHIDARP